MDFKKNIKELFSLRQGESATTTDAAQTLLSENRKEGETYKPKSKVICTQIRQLV